MAARRRDNLSEWGFSLSYVISMKVRKVGVKYLKGVIIVRVYLHAASKLAMNDRLAFDLTQLV